MSWWEWHNPESLKTNQLLTRVEKNMTSWTSASSALARPCFYLVERIKRVSICPRTCIRSYMAWHCSATSRVALSTKWKAWAMWRQPRMKEHHYHERVANLVGIILSPSGDCGERATFPNQRFNSNTLDGSKSTTHTTGNASQIVSGFFSS